MVTLELVGTSFGSSRKLKIRKLSHLFVFLPGAALALKLKHTSQLRKRRYCLVNQRAETLRS